MRGKRKKEKTFAENWSNMLKQTYKIIYIDVSSRTGKNLR